MALVFTILGGGCARKAEPPVEVPPDEDIKWPELEVAYKVHSEVLHAGDGTTLVELKAVIPEIKKPWPQPRHNKDK